MNSRKKKAIGCLFTFLFSFYLFFRESPFIIFCGCPTDGNNSIYSQGVFTLGTINRAQQTYHYVNKTFASTLTKLEIEFDDTKQILVEVTKNAFFSQLKTINIELDADCYKKAPLFYYIFYKNLMAKKESVKYTLIGAIFFSEPDKYQTIICESNNLGWQQLNKPFLKDGKPVCGEGTTEYR